MRIYLDGSKKYCKANLHTHSALSYGRATPDEPKKQYMDHGYSVTAFTDHEHIVDNSYLTEATFKLSPNEKLFRIRREDERGECAYTQPYGVELD